MIKYSLSEKLKLSLEKILKICLWPKYCPQVLPWIVETAGSYNYRRPDQDRTISNHDSNHCDIFTDCVHHSKCPHYLEQSEKLKTVALDTSEYTRIRGELRQLICNQKERKVCCEPTPRLVQGPLLEQPQVSGQLTWCRSFAFQDILVFVSDSSQNCRTVLDTEYKTAFKQECSTIYEDQCSTSYEKSCFTR